MDKLIANFPNQIRESIEIGQNAKITSTDKKFQNIVVCGLGGSGIGGSLIQDLTEEYLSIPFVVNKKYTIPNFVDENSLVIISSYSGNTEETLESFDRAIERKAHIVTISSGGKIEEIAKKHGFDHIKVPGGMSPRACLGYSFIQQFFVLKAFGFIGDNFLKILEDTITLLEDNAKEIEQEGKELAENIYNKMPVIYAPDTMEALSIRWKQQINENGKQLCWQHAIPEMNHNELVGWRTADDNLAVIILRNKSDYARIQQRMEINKTVFKEYTPNVYEVWSKGETMVAKTLYLNLVGDWCSFYLSELRDFDPIEVKVIDYLKGELAKS